MNFVGYSLIFNVTIGLTMKMICKVNHHYRTKQCKKLSGYSLAIHEYMGERYLTYTLTKGIQDGRSIMGKVNIPLTNFNPVLGASRLKAARNNLKNVMASIAGPNKNLGGLH
jgi:hypothetical protein